MCEVLSLVERGWGGARELSRWLATQQISVVHLARGQVTREVRQLVPMEPRNRLYGVPVKLFAWVAVASVLIGARCSRLALVLVDHERRASQLRSVCRACGVLIVMLQDANHTTTYAVDGRSVTRETLVALARRRAHPTA